MVSKASSLPFEDFPVVVNIWYYRSDFGNVAEVTGGILAGLGIIL